MKMIAVFTNWIFYYPKVTQHVISTDIQVKRVDNDNLFEQKSSDFRTLITITDLHILIPFHDPMNSISARRICKTFLIYGQNIDGKYLCSCLTIFLEVSETIGVSIVHPSVCPYIFHSVICTALETWEG